MVARGPLNFFDRHGLWLTLLLLVFLVGCMEAPDATAPDDLAAGGSDPTEVRNMTVHAYALGYMGRDGSYPSDIVATSQGDALATYQESRSGIVNGLISHDGGRTWSDPIPLTDPASMPGSERPGMPSATVATGPTTFAIVLKEQPASRAEYDNSPWTLITVDAAAQEAINRFTLHPAPGSPDLRHAAIDLAAMPDGSLLLAAQNTLISEPGSNVTRLLSGVSAWRVAPDGELNLLAKLHEPLPMGVFSTSVAIAGDDSGGAAVVWSTVTGENRWQVKQLYFSIMDSNGSFSAPEAFDVLPTSHPGQVNGPQRLRIDAEGRLHFGVDVRYWTLETLENTGTDFYHASLDMRSGNVRTTKLNTLGGPGQRAGSGHDGAVDVQGSTVWAVWMEPAEGGWTAYAARSADAGATFEAPFRLQALEYGLTRDHIFLGNSGRHLALLPDAQPLLVATTELPSALPLIDA